MNHPSDLLPEYVLEELNDRETRQVAAHLATCERCRAEVYELNEGLLRLSEALPEVALPARVWERIRAEVGPREVPSLPATRHVWGPRLALGALSVLVVFTVLFGYDAFQERVRLERILASLSDTEEVLTLAQGDGSAFGRAFLVAEERCLMVLDAPPPAGQVYQVWGYRNGVAVSLGVFNGRSFEVSYDGYELMGISLEPPAGSSQPTRLLDAFPVS